MGNVSPKAASELHGNRNRDESGIRGDVSRARATPAEPGDATRQRNETEFTAREFMRAYESGGRTFTNTRFKYDLLHDCEIVGVDFSGSAFEFNCVSVTFRDCKFTDDCSVSRKCGFVTFERCDFSNGWLSGDHSHGEFQDCRFDQARIALRTDQCNFLGSCTFDGASLTDCSFTNSSFGSTVILRRATFQGGNVMDLATFGSLPDGALNSWQESAIAIDEDGIRLRQSFSGLKRSLYVVLFGAFLAPHVLFIGRTWFVGNAICPRGLVPCVPLYQAVLNRFTEGGPLLTASFVFVFTYHLVRTVLVAKASALEVQHSARGTRVRFSLDDAVFPLWAKVRARAEVNRYIQQRRGGPLGVFDVVAARLPLPRWAHLVAIVQYGFLVNLALLAYHAWHFGQAPVPR